MNIIMQLLGRLHPLIVHLPIGFIVLALILSWYDRKEKTFTNGIAISFLWGGITSVLACISGYLLYQTEGFSFDTVKIHLWSGIITAIFCFLAYARKKDAPRFIVFNRIRSGFYLLILFVLISITGHLGGSITHGEEYLVEPLPNSVKSLLGIEVFEKQEIILTEETWEEALLYDAIIHPILNNKCLSCHSSKKAKGELILQSPEAILRGGENGDVLVSNHPDKSALYTKLVLPLGDDDRMPPDGKTQLTKAEVRLISEWIERGNSFEKSNKELGINVELVKSFFPRKINNNYPDVYVEKVIAQFIDSIEAMNVYVEKINKKSHFLSVTCINQPTFEDANFALFLPIAENISMLDLGTTRVTDAIFSELKKLPNLTVLKLDNTTITGENIKELTSLQHLKFINLASTQFKEANLSTFLEFQRLEKVFLHNTDIKAGNMKAFAAKEIKVDFGNYALPTIESDSIIF
jgi:uncharacterized membrane protein